MGRDRRCLRVCSPCCGVVLTARTFARLAAPSLAGVALRMAQLLVLFALAAAALPGQRDAVLAAFGVASAFAIVADAGSLNFLLSADQARVTRWMVDRCLRLQCAVGLLGAIGAIAVCVVRFPVLRDSTLLVVVTCLALTPMLDSCFRVARAYWLVQSADHRFALYDGLSALVKAIVAAIVVWRGDVTWCVILPLASLLMLAIAGREMRSVLPTGRPLPALRASVLVFGANGAASALYSQSPMVVASLTLPVEVVAVLTICYRVTQPLELLPSTLAQQVLPRLRSGRIGVGVVHLSFSALGLSCAVAVVLAIPGIEQVFSTPLVPELLPLVVAAALPFKFGNYAMAASMFARSMVREKLAVTIVVGLVALGCAVVFGRLGSAVGVASTTLGAEFVLMLAMGGSLGLHRSSRGSAGQAVEGIGGRP